MQHVFGETTTLSYRRVEDIWVVKDITELFSSLQASCVIHTAGPYADGSPAVLDAAIAAKIPAYVDVSDTIPFLEASLERTKAAINAGTTALCAAGGFPGMSNVLAMRLLTLLTLPSKTYASTSLPKVWEEVTPSICTLPTLGLENP